jgi:endonuclease III
MIVYGANEALTWARRVAQFQNVMRNVLGDRRKTFTWSGSVTDSVVGAFLTQNVSDALSSRAYMELVSRWPAKHNGTTSTTAPSSSSAAVALTLGDEADTVDWEAIRTAPINDLADAIRCRGMQMVLSTNIQSFLNHLRRYNLLKKAVRVAATGGFRGIETDVLATVDSMMDAIVENAELGEEKDVATVVEDLIEGAELNVTSGNSRLEQEGSIGEKSAPTISRRSPSRSHISLAYENQEGQEQEKEDSALETPPPPPPLPPQQSSHEAALEAARLLSSEWLRDAPDDEARDFLMSINGLGRKSVACIMLLTLGKKEFPVDTNVGRICSRLGWIPLDAAESIEELDDYAPEPEVHAYLRSRLLGFDIETLYELHYQMITLGKVFCSKQSPNCTACPMQKECEYALQNGPSLHGRKRVKVNKASQGGDAAAGGAPFLNGDGFMMPTSPLPGSTRLPPGSNNGSKGIHWRTQQKIERLAQEKIARELAIAEHARRYSTLDLEDLVYTRTTRPRSENLRRPRGMSAEDAASSRLQRAEAEVKVLAGVAQWQKIYPINWLNLDTMELGVRGLLPASIWDTSVARETQQAQKESITAEGNEGDATAPASYSIKDELKMLSAWEEALRNAPSTLQYPNTAQHTADQAVELAVAREKQDLPLSIWDLAGRPPPPRARLPSIPQQQQQQHQLEVEAAGPPVLLKSKPVAAEGGEGEGEKAPAADGAGGGGDAAVIDLTNAAVDFIPPEGTEEMDITTTNIAELLPELMSWVPPPELCIPPATTTAAAPAAAPPPLPEEKIQEKEDSMLLDEPATPPEDDFIALPLPTVASLLSSPSSIEAECRRLQQLAGELAAENEVMLKLDHGADASIHRKRLLELSLQALKFDLSLSVDSAESVVIAARREYRQLARALHPDKCKLPGAADAFSGLSMAMRIVSEYSIEKEQQEDKEREKKNAMSQGDGDNNSTPSAAAVDGAGCGDSGTAPYLPSPSVPSTSLEHRIVWNQSRLVVAAHILPAHIHRTFSHLNNTGTQTASGSGNDSSDDEQQVMFLPMNNIPTFQREELAGRRSATTAVTATAKPRSLGLDGSRDDVELVMDGLLNTVCGREEGGEERDVLVAAATTATAVGDGSLPVAEEEQQEEDEFVEGMLLVTCRAALRGRFPLNGTYFQINELFADHQTAIEAIKVSDRAGIFLFLNLFPSFKNTQTSS